MLVTTECTPTQRIKPRPPKGQPGIEITQKIEVKIKEKHKTTADNYFYSLSKYLWTKLQANGWKDGVEFNRQDPCLQ